MHSSILLTIRKGLKINIVEISKNSILIIAENMECKDFKIKLIRKELLLNIYCHIY